MKRRAFIAGLGSAAAWPLAAAAQQPGRVWRVGFLGPERPTDAMLSAFRDGLRERGYVEGQNLSVDFRWPQGTFEQNPSVAAELIRSNVDMLVAWATPAVIAPRRATSTIPIVMTNVGDPLGSGFVASLARPGGNVTGVSNISRDLSGKLIQHLVEIVPGMNRVGVVHNASNPAVTVELRETEDAIRALIPFPERVESMSLR
jgi:putative ABC transport system substrate-binding protein